MATLPSNQTTRLLVAWSQGDQQALDALMPLVYDELRRVARRSLRRERQDHTLQSAALVNEAYLRMIDQKHAQWQNRAQFFGIAAQMMRRILVDHARRRSAQKRGAGDTALSLNEELGIIPPHAPRPLPQVDLLALDVALHALEEKDPRQSRLVELRFFAGLSIEEAAEVLSVSPATVKREWAIAKAWLYREIAGSEIARSQIARSEDQ